MTNIKSRYSAIRVGFNNKHRRNLQSINDRKFYINDISTGSLKLISSWNISNCTLGLYTAQLLIFFSDSDIFKSLDMKQSDFPLGIKKYVHLAEAPKRGILFLGHPELVYL